MLHPFLLHAENRTYTAAGIVGPVFHRDGPVHHGADALAHVVTNKVEAAYARSDLFGRRRRLMDDWAAYLRGCPGE